MRAIAISALIVLLSGCATQAERAAAMQRDVDDMIKVYGPACEKLGYKNDTDPWRDCVLRLATRDSLERSRREPVFTNCIGHRGFFQCSAL
ncbi:MAG TPA: hypothetical protein VGV08_06050 [Casimicrobiaceae bacterium]|nr:hypothetical protein [Casimicrobiaceae bacterium]